MFKKISTTNVKYASVLFFVLLSIYPVYGKTIYNGVHILVGVIPEETGMERKLDKLIYNLLVFEFEHSGLITEKIELESNDSLELLLSNKSETGLAAICTYTTLGNRVLLDLELYDSRTMLILAASSTSADINLSFDKVISSVVMDLLAEADEELKRRVVNIDSRDSSIDIEEDIIEEDIIEEKTEPELSKSDSGSKGGLELFLNTGFTSGIGSTNDVPQNPGPSAEFAANYWFFTSSGLFGIGAIVSANYYPAVRLDGSIKLILFPVGIVASYSTSTIRPFSAIVQVGTGFAVASLLFEGANPISKVLPYINAAGGLGFNFNEKISLGLKLTYNVYFEDNELLTALTPSIYVSFRSWN